MGKVSRKRASPKEVFWDEKIRAWQKTNLPQSTYCELNGLSITAFSKWRKRLHPKLTVRHPVYKSKSKYYKFTKISDQKIEALIKCFLCGVPAKEASEKTGIRQNTIYTIYNDFRLAFVTNALLYWKLFNGAGTFLMLGMPPNLGYILRLMETYLPAHKPNKRAATIRSRKNLGVENEGSLKSNLQLLTTILIYFSKCRLTLAEAENFRSDGYRAFYKYVYAPHNNLNPGVVIKQPQLDWLQEEAKEPIVMWSNWNYCVTTNNRKPIFPNDFWIATTKNKEVETNISEGSDWHRDMFRDFCWVLKHHKISEKHKVMSTYWDEFKPTWKETSRANIELIKERFRQSPKTKGQWTLSELVALGELQKEKK